MLAGKGERQTRHHHETAQNRPVHVVCPADGIRTNPPHPEQSISKVKFGAVSPDNLGIHCQYHQVHPVTDVLRTHVASLDLRHHIL